MHEALRAEVGGLRAQCFPALVRLVSLVVALKVRCAASAAVGPRTG